MRIPHRHRIETELLALVPHRPDAGGLGIDAAFPVAHHGVVSPAAFPQGVDDPHVFLGEIVTVVVRHLFAQSHRPRGAVQVAGDDVPADASLRQVVQRRHAACEQEGWFVGEVAGHAEPQMRGRVRHGGDQRQRIDQGDLHGGA